jgi:predicted transcriptional regulator
MKVRKVQAVIYIFKTLLERGFIKKSDIQRKISLQDVAFRRYIQELRAYLVNFNEPYEIVYVKSKDAYFLRNI